MENQHRMITGYGELTADDIALVNEIKAFGPQLEGMVAKVLARVQSQRNASFSPVEDEAFRKAERIRIEGAEPERWARIGKTHLQEGLMALVRAVMQPTTF